MKERSIKELLILLRDYFPQSVKDGRGALCFALQDMYEDEDMITLREKIKVDVYIHKNPPPEYQKYAPYFFPEGRLIPRIKYLNELISKL